MTKPPTDDHRVMIRVRGNPGIFRRGNKYVVTYRDAFGKSRREPAQTLAEARAIRAARLTARDRGELFDASKMLFRDYASQWIERYPGRRGRFSESTRQNYRADLERYAYAHFGRLRLCDIAPPDIASFVGWLTDEHAQARHDATLRRRAGLKSKKGQVARSLGDSTIRNIVNPVRACLSTAVQEGLIRHNPAREIPLPNRRKADSGESRKARAFSREQLAAVLANVHPTHRLLLEFLAVTGLRASEVRALQWRDLILDGSGSRLRVGRKHYRGRTEAPKSASGFRDVPLDPGVVKKLRKLRMRSQWSGDTDLVFPNEVGKPMHLENLRRRHLRPMLGEHGLEWASLHTFRHTCATLLFARGKNAAQVSAWLGHASPKITLDTYIHLLDGELGEGLDLGAELVAASPMPAVEVPDDAVSVPA